MPHAIADDDARIHYEVYGTEGPWVVLLMGLGAPSGLWLDIPQRLVGGDTPYRVLAIDSLGTGKSGRMRAPATLRSMARHVVSAMDHAGVQRAYLAGMSMGGMIAQHVALSFAHRLEGLVLMATSPGILHGGLPTLRALRSLVRTALRRSEDARLVQDLVADLILHPDERSRAREIIDLLAPAARASPTTSETFIWQLLACTLHSTGRDLARICTPTVVVTGDHDIVMGPRGSHLLAERIPGALLEIVPRCGHGITFTHPDALSRALARLRAARA